MEKGVLYGMLVIGVITLVVISGVVIVCREDLEGRTVKEVFSSSKKEYEDTEVNENPKFRIDKATFVPGTKDYDSLSRLPERE